MEVYTKLIRRLITGNAPAIFPQINRQIENPSNYRLLVEEIQKAAESTDLARNIAEAIAGNDNDLFKDFDLDGFMRHFDLDALGRSVLALGFKQSPKQDLRTKGKEIQNTSRSLVDRVVFFGGKGMLANNRFRVSISPRNRYLCLQPHA